jgi:aquaporin Z
MDNTSVNPARSLGPALFQGGWALGQLWLFIAAPIVGAVATALVHQVLWPVRGAQPAAIENARVPSQQIAQEAART